MLDICSFAQSGYFKLGPVHLGPWVQLYAAQLSAPTSESWAPGPNLPRTAQRMFIIAYTMLTALLTSAGLLTELFRLETSMVTAGAPTVTPGLPGLVINTITGNEITSCSPNQKLMGPSNVFAC